jgi:hypothetical protein
MTSRGASAVETSLRALDCALGHKALTPSQVHREHFRCLAVELDRRLAMTRTSYAELAKRLAQARRLASEPNDRVTRLRLVEFIRDLETEIQALLQFA